MLQTGRKQNCLHVLIFCADFNGKIYTQSYKCMYIKKYKFSFPPIMQFEYAQMEAELFYDDDGLASIIMLQKFKLTF